MGALTDGAVQIQDAKSLGDHYSGDFVDELPSGEGTMRYADGSEYVGHWLKGE